MNKKPILSKHPKKLIVFLLVCLITITLAGCDSSNKKPTGDLPLSDVYASVGTHKVTVEEVYNKLRYNALSYVENRVYNFLYSEEINQVKADLAENGKGDYKERIDDKILHEIYGVHEEDELNDLTDKAKDIAVKKYVDNMYKKGYVISSEDVVAKNFSSVYPNYYLEIAKYIAAKNKLEAEFKDLKKDEDGNITSFGEITDETYFTKEDVVEWYETNYENTGDVTAILIRFINEAEINEIFKKFGLKQANNKWYQIKLDPEKESDWNTKNGYDKYYEDYKIDLSSDAPLTSVDVNGNGRATVLKIYAAIYNYVYVYRNPINLTDETINDQDGHLKYYRYIERIIRETGDENEYDELVEKLVQYNEDNSETTVLTKDRLDKYSTSLRSYVYGLKTEAEEEGKPFTQYSTKGQSKGSYYYLVFKVAQDEIEKEMIDGEHKPLYEEIEKEDDKVEINFTNETFLNEILNEMFDDEINDTYIAEAFDERVKEANIKIYDSIIEAQFMYNSTSKLAESYEKNKKKNKNNSVVAEVTYKDKTESINVKDVFNYLEPLNGPQIASNLLFQEYIKTTPYYEKLLPDYSDYEETVKLMLYYFSNDYYAGSGYPSSIGKYNFMMLYYGTANVEEVVYDYLMVSDATNAYFSDFTNRGFASTDEFYSNLVTYAEDTYKDFFSLNVSGLTVYADKDEDGEADDITSVENEAKELLTVALQEVKNSHTDYSTALNNIVSDYNSSSRSEDEANNPTTPESKWAKYRKLGLHIKVSNYSTITNTTDGVDEGIVNRTKALYPTAVDSVLGFTSAVLDEELITTKDNEVTTLLITGGSKPTSAVFKSEDDEVNDLYDSIKVVINNEKDVIDVKYDTEMVNLNQVKVYVSEYVLLGDVYSLPSTTNAALDAYILPLITKYTGSASQQKIVAAKFAELGALKFDYETDLSVEANPEFNSAFIADYNNKDRAGFLEKYNTILQDSEDGYDPQQENWWTTMYKG